MTILCIKNDKSNLFCQQNTMKSYQMNEPMRFSDSFQIQKDYQLKSVCETSYHRMYSPYARTSYQQPPTYPTDEHLHYSTSNISETLEEQQKFIKTDEEVNDSSDSKHYTILEPAGIDSKAASVLQDVARDGPQTTAAAASGGSNVSVMASKSPGVNVGESSMNKSLYPFTHGNIDKGECALNRLIHIHDLPQIQLNFIKFRNKERERKKRENKKKKKHKTYRYVFRLHVVK